MRVKGEAALFTNMNKWLAFPGLGFVPTTMYLYELF